VIDRKYIDGTATPGVQIRRRETGAAARALDLALILVDVDKLEDFEHAFAVITRDRAEALIVMGTNVNYAHQRRIIEFIARQRLPSISDDREWPEAGGLLGYGANTVDLMRRAVTYSTGSSKEPSLPTCHSSNRRSSSWSST
jgi:putative tryptophan/tyrosine transport system substrate-binding protein